MSHDDERAKRTARDAIAARQAAVAQALSTGASAPEGFDRARLEAARAALREKKARESVRAERLARSTPPPSGLRAALVRTFRAILGR